MELKKKNQKKYLIVGITGLIVVILTVFFVIIPSWQSAIQETQQESSNFDEFENQVGLNSSNVGLSGLWKDAEGGIRKIVQKGNEVYCIWMMSSDQSDRFEFVSGDTSFKGVMLSSKHFVGIIDTHKLERVNEDSIRVKKSWTALEFLVSDSLDLILGKWQNTSLLSSSNSWTLCVFRRLKNGKLDSSFLSVSRSPTKEPALSKRIKSILDKRNKGAYARGLVEIARSKGWNIRIDISQDPQECEDFFERLIASPVVIDTKDIILNVKDKFRTFEKYNFIYIDHRAPLEKLFKYLNE